MEIVPLVHAALFAAPDLVCVIQRHKVLRSRNNILIFQRLSETIYHNHGGCIIFGIPLPVVFRGFLHDPCADRHIDVPAISIKAMDGKVSKFAALWHRSGSAAFVRSFGRFGCAGKGTTDCKHSNKDHCSKSVSGHLRLLYNQSDALFDALATAGHGGGGIKQSRALFTGQVNQCAAIGCTLTFTQP